MKKKAAKFALQVTAGAGIALALFRGLDRLGLWWLSDGIFFIALYVAAYQGAKLIYRLKG